MWCFRSVTHSNNELKLCSVVCKHESESTGGKWEVDPTCRQTEGKSKTCPLPGSQDAGNWMFVQRKAVNIYISTNIYMIMKVDELNEAGNVQVVEP